MPETVLGEAPAPPESIVVECRLPTAEETALYERAIKAHEQSIPVLNDSLQKLLTLDAALIGGGFVVAKGDVLPYWCGVAVLGFLIASLASVLYGFLPSAGIASVHSLGGPEAYRRFELDVMKKKRLAVLIASALLVAAFLIGAGGLVARGAPERAPVQDPGASGTKN